jgi:hypothetical protein
MRDLVVVFIHFIATRARLLRPGGARPGAGHAPRRSPDIKDQPGIALLCNKTHFLGVFCYIYRLIDKYSSLLQWIRGQRNFDPLAAASPDHQLSFSPQRSCDLRKSIAFSAKPRATDVNSLPPRIRFSPNRLSKILLTAGTNEEPPVRKTISTFLG